MLFWLLFYRPFFHSIQQHTNTFPFTFAISYRNMFCALSKLKQMLIGAHSQYVILIKTMEKQRFLVTWVWEMNGEKKTYPPKTIFAIFCVSVCFESALTQTSTLPPSMHRPNSVLFIQLIWEIINEKYKAKNAYRQPTDWIAKEPISYVFVFVSSRQIFWQKKENTNISKDCTDQGQLMWHSTACYYYCCHITLNCMNLLKFHSFLRFLRLNNLLFGTVVSFVYIFCWSPLLLPYSVEPPHWSDVTVQVRVYFFEQRVLK